MAEDHGSSAQEADTHREAETAVVALREEIARVEGMPFSTYRRGILSGLRDRLAEAGGWRGFPAGPPAHYTPRSAATWAEGKMVGLQRGEAILRPTAAPSDTQPGTSEASAPNPPQSAGE